MAVVSTGLLYEVVGFQAHDHAHWRKLTDEVVLEQWQTLVVQPKEIVYKLDELLVRFQPKLLLAQETQILVVIWAAELEFDPENKFQAVVFVHMKVNQWKDCSPEEEEEL